MFTALNDQRQLKEHRSVWYCGSIALALAFSGIVQIGIAQVPGQSMIRGATADGVMKQSGSYPSGASSAQIQQINHERFEQKRKQQNTASQAHNGLGSLALEQQQFLQELRYLKEQLSRVERMNRNVERSGYYQKPAVKLDMNTYDLALNDLKRMLDGAVALSLADAFYIEEAAYGKLHLSYSDYKAVIDQSTTFIRQWMEEHGLNENEPQAVHLAIQKFMGDTLSVRQVAPERTGMVAFPKGHYPYQYDYVDYRGEKDLRNYFLTKTLATGSGQCNTLPRVYLVLAEALGVDAYLCFAPQHSFIKYPDGNGGFANYEPTIDWHMSNQDYMEHMPVMAAALANRVYMQPLSKKQMVAVTILDLAYNFSREHWVQDGQFLHQCIREAMPYFHNGEGNADGLLLQSMVLSAQLEQAMHRAGITDLNHVERDPQTARIFAAYMDTEKRIRALGIQGFPEGRYLAMLKKHDQRGRLQMADGNTVKSVKSLFFTF